MSQEENQKPKVELRSEEVNDILGQIPHWILRWGMIMLLIALALILLGSWWFKYPDIVPADIKVKERKRRRERAGQAPPPQEPARTRHQAVFAGQAAEGPRHAAGAGAGGARPL